MKIAEKFGIEIETLVAGNNYALLNEQIKKFKPKFVVVKDADTAQKVNFKNVKWGEEAVLEVLEASKSETVVNALVGEAGLRPTLKAQELNKKIALANKESLVIAGKFMNISRITPIDSEHFGLWYLLKNSKNEAKKLYITASGGALRDWKLEEIKKATLIDVLKHPNWSMGMKITIDSATMVNKLFEILEARWLFGIKNVDAFIETKSIIHALVEFVDGSTTAHISKTDMKLPIAFALMGIVKEEILEPVNLAEVGSLEFRKIEKERYPVWEIKDLLLEKPDLGVVVNTANEFVIRKFINNETGFSGISDLILRAVYKFEDIKINEVEDLFYAQKEVREWCESNFV